MVKTADELGLIPRWHGLRLVAGDASVLMPAIRPCFTKRFHAKADQRLFALYLPGAELTLHASVHGADGAQRQMLFEALSCLGPDDVLILDRGYPAAWLVAYLTEHKIRFCMRCEKSSGGWAAVRAFERSDQVDASVTLNKPNKWDCEDYGCSGGCARGQVGQVHHARWTHSGDGDQFADERIPGGCVWPALP